MIGPFSLQSIGLHLGGSIRRALVLFLGAVALQIAATNAKETAKAENGAEAQEKRGVTILVIGSSSAAGKNIYKLFDRPKLEESGYAVRYNWVTLYREHLKAIDPETDVINFAVSGNSTSIALNERKGGEFYKSSLSYVLAQHPNADALIVNFPAVRGQEGEDAETVVENLKEIERRALASGVRKVWIATAQPYANKAECFKTISGRCDGGQSIYKTRADLTDAIIAAFPENHIDFYAPLAVGKSRTGVANPALLNRKDKLHPNLEGHEALKDAVIAAGIYEAATSE